MGENSDSATITYPEEPMTHRIPPQTIGRKTNRRTHSDALNGCITSSSMGSMDVKRFKLKIESPLLGKHFKMTLSRLLFWRAPHPFTIERLKAFVPEICPDPEASYYNRE